MDIKYFEDPAPHFIIDNFVPDRAARAILEECIDLEPFYEQAKIGGDRNAPEPEHCAECKTLFDNFRNLIRDNQTVGLDKIYTNNRQKSPTLRYLQYELEHNPEFKKAMQNAPHLFPLLNIVNTSESMISRYGKCEFYGWHTDSNEMGRSESRMMTISYYVNKEPAEFHGGNLLILGDDGTKKIIEPKHNRAVIFDSHNATHAVEYVDLAGKEWEDGRFSVQYWLGFNNVYKFR
jgi:Rps23 Pro-64 3,4-dihydroxylase Tpa1-like proline 4-hydroxylase